MIFEQEHAEKTEKSNAIELRWLRFLLFKTKPNYSGIYRVGDIGPVPVAHSHCSKSRIQFRNMRVTDGIAPRFHLAQTAIRAAIGGLLLSRRRAGCAWHFPDACQAQPDLRALTYASAYST